MVAPRVTKNRDEGCRPRRRHPPPPEVRRQANPSPSTSPEEPLRKVRSSPLTEKVLADHDIVSTFVRLRPSSSPALPLAYTQTRANDGVHSLEVARGTGARRAFHIDGVLDATATQDDVFAAVGRPVVDRILAGDNSSLLTYGQTGSGKTYTMLGAVEGPDRGLLARILQTLLAQAPDAVCDVSYFEIYGDKVHDLLDTLHRGAKCVREDTQLGTIFVQDLVSRTVRSSAEANALLLLGAKHRRVGSTAMNRDSSRSHAILQMTLTQARTQSVLYCVDLAGSETHTSLDAHEVVCSATQINKSLSCLANVITALVDVSNGMHRHVPYRDSKLTFLLRDALTAKTTIVATISSDARHVTETLATLQFVQRAKSIRGTTVGDCDLGRKIRERCSAQLHTLEKTTAALVQSAPSKSDVAVQTCLPIPTDVTSSSAATSVTLRVSMALCLGLVCWYRWRRRR